jgi:hypothetical protein
MPVVKQRKCPNQHDYDVLMWPDGDALPQSNADPLDLSLDCPTCGATEYTELLFAGHGINLNKGGPVSYPYWDDTLGAQVESHAHMLRLAAAKGLVPMESRNSTGTRQTAEERAWEASADAGKAFLERQETEPWYREMRDKCGVQVRTRTGEVKTVIRQDKYNEFARERKLGRG